MKKSTLLVVVLSLLSVQVANATPTWKILTGVAAISGIVYLINQDSNNTRRIQHMNYHSYNQRMTCHVVKKPIQISYDTYKLVSVKECYYLQK